MSISQSVSEYSQALGNDCVQGLWLEQSLARFGWDQQRASSQVLGTAEESALRSLLVLWGEEYKQLCVTPIHSVEDSFPLGSTRSREVHPEPFNMLNGCEHVLGGSTFASACNCGPRVVRAESGLLHVTLPTELLPVYSFPLSDGMARAALPDFQHL